MKTEILYCSSCKKYTIQQVCEKCGQKCLSPKPAKFSIEDKWGEYRRIAKLQSKDL